MAASAFAHFFEKLAIKKASFSLAAAIVENGTDIVEATIEVDNELEAVISILIAIVYEKSLPKLRTLEEVASRDRIVDVVDQCNFARIVCETLDVEHVEFFTSHVPLSREGFAAASKVLIARGMKGRGKRARSPSPAPRSSKRARTTVYVATIITPNDLPTPQIPCTQVRVYSTRERAEHWISQELADFIEERLRTRDMSSRVFENIVEGLRDGTLELGDATGEDSWIFKGEHCRIWDYEIEEAVIDE